MFVLESCALSLLHGGLENVGMCVFVCGKERGEMVASTAAAETWGEKGE